MTAPVTEAERALVRDSYAMIDSLRGKSTVHKVVLVWAFRDALAGQDLTALIAAAAEYVNLLDHEAIHGKEHDSYGGAEGDTAAMRAHLRRIPWADALHPERGSPWPPAGRIR